MLQSSAGIARASGLPTRANPVGPRGAGRSDGVALGGQTRPVAVSFVPIPGVEVHLERLGSPGAARVAGTRLAHLPRHDRLRLSTMVDAEAIDEACRSLEFLLRLRHRLVREGRLGSGSRLHRSEAGRPILTSPAAGPVDVNVSHGGGFLAVAHSLTGAVGVDLEVPRHPTPALVEDVCTPGEAAWLGRSGSAAGLARRFARLWTHKEALLKAVGCGLALDPKRIEFDFSGPEGRLRASPFRGSFDFRGFTLTPGTILVVCLRRAGVPERRLPL